MLLVMPILLKGQNNKQISDNYYNLSKKYSSMGQRVKVVINTPTQEDR